MKILQVTPYYLPSVGGIEFHIENLSKFLVKRGVDVTIFTSNLPSSQNFEVLDGIKIFRFNPALLLFENPIVISMLFKLVNSTNYDIIHAHDEHGFSTNLAAFVGNLKKKPLVITCHGDLYPLNFKERVIITAYEKTLLSYSLKRANSVIALSETHKESLTRFIPSHKIEVIPNAIDLQKFETKINFLDFIEKHQLNGKKIILYVGQLIKRKGLQYLLRAIRQVKDEIKNVILIIVGKGPYRNTLDRIIKDLKLESYAKFLGYIPEKELLKAYAGSNIIVLPSLAEGVPTILMEAMAFSKAIISTEITSFPSFFKNAMLLVPPRNVKELTKAIIRLLSDEKEVERIGRSGRTLVEKHFSWDNVVDKVIELYKKLLQ